MVSGSGDRVLGGVSSQVGLEITPDPVLQLTQLLVEVLSDTEIPVLDMTLMYTAASFFPFHLAFTGEPGRPGGPSLGSWQPWVQIVAVPL